MLWCVPDIAAMINMYILTVFIFLVLTTKPTSLNSLCSFSLTKFKLIALAYQNILAKDHNLQTKISKVCEIWLYYYIMSKL